jgi:hypothetical protein
MNTDHQSQTARNRHISAMPEQDRTGRDAPSAERTKAYRQRLKEAGATHADRPPCLLCGKPVLLGQIDPASARGRSRTGSVLCATCWRKSDEGKAAERERNRARVRSRRGAEQSQIPDSPV